MLVAVLLAAAVATPPVKAVFDPDAAETSQAAAMERLAGLVLAGTWQCEGQVVPADKEQPEARRLLLRVQGHMNGAWWQIATHPPGGRAAQGPELNEFFSFDASDDRYTRVAIDQAGHSSVMTADNTDGSRLTFAGPTSMWGKRRDTRVVLEAQPKGLYISWDVSGAHGNWVRTRALSCRQATAGRRPPAARPTPTTKPARAAEPKPAAEPTSATEPTPAGEARPATEPAPLAP